MNKHESFQVSFDNGQTWTNYWVWDVRTGYFLVNARTDPGNQLVMMVTSGDLIDYQSSPQAKATLDGQEVLIRRV